MRIIRKYPNRRLYDTDRSAYITLEEIRKLVIEQVPFQVVDKRTGADITRGVLLQIISEGEDDNSPVFSTEVLQQIIRFHGDTLQQMLGEYLKMSIGLFVEQQDRFVVTDQQTSIDPVALLSDLTKRNIEFWASLFPTDILRDPETKKDEEPSK